MKKLSVVSATVSAFAVQSLSALANPSTAPTLHSRVATAPECQKDTSDPFDFGARGSQGLDKGKCIQFDYRPIVVLTPAEMEQHGIPSVANHVAIANVPFSDAQSYGFYIANIPLDSAYEARLLIENFFIAAGTPFAVNPGHSMIRVLFNSDVQIFEQRSGKMGLKHSARELIFSVHSSGRFTPARDFLTRVTDGSFALTGSVFTFPGKFQNPAAPLDNIVEQWRLSLSPDKISEFVKRYIQRANRNGAKNLYHLTESNCISELFQIFDKIFTYTEAQQHNISKTEEGEWIPSLAPWSFEARGLLNISNKLPNINSEL